MFRAILAAAAALGAVAAQSRRQANCANDAPARGDLGVIISADATVNRNPSPARPWRFRSPIEVAAVIADGPSEGILQVGDLVTAIDGMPITSDAGAQRLAGLRPGETARLAVTRRGAPLQLSVRARAICPEDPDAIGSYAPRPAPPRSMNRNEGVPVPSLPDLEPAGWLGIALACRGCGWAKEATDSFPYWESSDYPVIHALAPGGPADRAGIRIGDTLIAAAGLPVTGSPGGRALGAVQPGVPIELTLRRDGRPHRFTVTPSARGDGSVPDRRYATVIAGASVEVSAPSAISVVVEEKDGAVTVRAGDAIVRVTPTR